MSAVLPHYKSGPLNKQVSTLIFGGQLVAPTTLTAGTTDLTVAPAAALSLNVLGVAGADANVIANQTGAPNSFGQPLIDISVLGDFVPVYYGGIDILVWYNNSVSVIEGAMLVAGANGTVTTVGANVFGTVVGRCTQPGGVTTAMCTQQIGGTGAANFGLFRARIF